MSTRDRQDYRAPSACPARRAGASLEGLGLYPANELFMHVVMAGCEIRCLACGDDGRLPLPRDPRYSAAVEHYLERHRLCQAAEEGRP